MWILTKEMRFEASHRLTEHDGKCRDLHGHSWVARVSVKGSRLYEEGPEKGMVVDFTRLKRAMERVRSLLDHRHLNDVLEVAGYPKKGVDYPTSENVARWIYHTIEDALILGDMNFEMDSVEVEETRGSRCTYRPDPPL